MSEANAVDRPLITFALFAYNQERFIADAVQGALNQTYSPLEVILSDDCSVDQTFAIMQTMADRYHGPHKVIARQNERNLGLAGHINRVMQAVGGELVVVAAGDDVSLPERVQKIYEGYCAAGHNAFSLYSKSIFIDMDEKQVGEVLDNPLEDTSLAVFGRNINRWVPGATQAWHRAVFDRFGPLDERVISEDVITPFRAALLGEVVFIDEVLVKRRLHESNISRPYHARSNDMKREWYINRQFRNLQNVIGILTTRLKDIETIWNERPDLQDDLAKFRSVYKRRLQDAHLELQYLESKTDGMFGLLIAGIRGRTPAKRLMRWFFQYTTPHLYYELLPAIKHIIKF